MCRLYGIVCLLFRTLLIREVCYFSSFYINGPNKSPFIRVPMQSWHRKNINRDTLGPYIGRKQHGFERSSLRSRRLELVGTRKNGRAKMRHARGEGCQIIRLGAGNDFLGLKGRRSLTLRVSPSGAPVLSFGHYFQASALKAMKGVTLVAKRMLRIMRISNYFGISLNKLTRNWITIALTSCL